MQVGDLVSYQDIGDKWVGVVKEIIPGFAQYALVCWIDPRNGKLKHSSINPSDIRIKIESKADVQPG